MHSLDGFIIKGCKFWGQGALFSSVFIHHVAQQDLDVWLELAGSTAVYKIKPHIYLFVKHYIHLWYCRDKK